MSIGPLEDLRAEIAIVFDDFEPTDLSKCGESLTFAPVCGLTLGAMASGYLGFGVVGTVDPYKQYSGLKRMDYGLRIEGRWDRLSFSVSDFLCRDLSFHVAVVQPLALIHL